MSHKQNYVRMVSCSLRLPIPLVLLILALLLLSTPACNEILPPPIPTPTTGPEQTVRLEVVEGIGGSVLAFVPIFVEGQGPFSFALDTGASQTLIDQEIASQLNLPVLGSSGAVIGVTGVREGQLVRVEQWRAGDIPLPSSTIVSLELPSGHGGVKAFRGLLGSDILSTFGAITVDYDRELLILRARQ